MVEAELADVKAKLAALLKPQLLFTQAADKCVLNMSGDKPTIESAHFHGDTVVFTDRPLTNENTTYQQPVGSTTSMNSSMMEMVGQTQP